MHPYTFDLLQRNIAQFREKDHIIPANSLTDAIQKFVRKHDLEMPAYWDEPSYDKHIELTFKNESGSVKYRITW